jgi:O-antigen/teichoic acid export membrane protein
VAVTAATIIVAFVATPLLVEWLGEARYGAARALTDWFGLLTLAELGLAGTLPPLLALALGKGDAAAVRRTLGAGMRAYAFVAVAAMSGAVLIALFAGKLVRVEPALLGDLRTAVLVGIAGLALYPLLPFQSLVDAQQRGFIIQAFQLTQSLTTTALALVLARAGWGITGQLLALTAGLVVFRIGLALAGARSLQPPRVERPGEGEWHAIRHLNMPTFLTAMAGRVGLYTDNIVVGLLLGPTHVAQLFLTQRLASLAGNQLLGLGNASWAALAELHALGRRETFNARLLDLTRVVAGLAVAALIPIAAYNHHFVAIWVGPENFGGWTVTLLACANGYLLAVFSLWGWCFGGTGLMPVITPIAIIGAVINVSVSLVATRLAGLPGPLIGTFSSLVLTSTWMLPLRLSQHFGTPAGALLRAAGMPLLWGLPAGALLLYWTSQHTPAGWIMLLAEMAAAALVLLVMWWMLALGPEERALLRDRVRIALK